MGNARFSDDFKQDAVHQITVRGDSVKDVSQRLGVSTHLLYSWVKKNSKSSEVIDKDDHSTESFFNLLKRERIRRRTCKNREEARRDVFGYIEMLYNPKRKYAETRCCRP